MCRISFQDSSHLRVIPRMDVGFYKNKKITIDEISDNLNVDYILDGSVTIINENMRINLELLSIANKDVVWAESYNKTVSDIFTVQDDIAEKITSNIDLIFSNKDLLDVKKRPTYNLEDYQFNELFRYCKSVRLVRELDSLGKRSHRTNIKYHIVF